MAAPLADILESLRQELARLHVEALDLQAALPAPSDVQGRVALQRLDGLTQALDGLAGFVGAVEAAARAGAPLDAAQAARGVTLHDLSARLARRAAPAGSPVASGDAELF